MCVVFKDIWVLQAVWIVDVTLVKTQEKQAGSGISRYLKLRVARILLKYLAIACRCSMWSEDHFVDENIYVCCTRYISM